MNGEFDEGQKGSGGSADHLEMVPDEKPQPPAIVVRPKAKPQVKPSSVREIVSKAQADGPTEEAKVIARIGIGRSVVTSSNYAGLSPVQRRFLLHRALVESDKAAAHIAGTTEKQIGIWLEESDLFRRAYGALWVDPASFSVIMLDNLLPKAVDVLEQALSSEKQTDRLRAVRLIMESKGILKPGPESANEYERNLARQLHERGKTVPPNLRHYIEGDYRVIEDAGS